MKANKDDAVMVGRHSNVCKLLLAFLLLSPLFSPLALADERVRSLESLESKEFTRSSILARFDKDGDGSLSQLERAALRQAYGDVDVPLLPDEPHRYSIDPSPRRHGGLDLRKYDNTSPRNPIQDAGATLGRVLFYDRRLSKNNKISCASCHDQKHAFADPRRFSVGFLGGRTKRNAMGLANMRFTVVKEQQPGFFWDERAATLEEQVLAPIQDKLEMGMGLPELERKLQQLPYYPAMFKNAFDSPQVTSERISKALAQFLRSIVSFNSKFDRAAAATGRDYARDFPAFSTAENLGKSLFINGVGNIGEFGCAHCHIPPTFAMPKSFNNGLDAVYIDAGLGARNIKPNDPFTPSNDGKFKSSSLRNVAITAPYMHDGRFATLEEVVEHYSSGVHRHENLGLALPEESNDKSGTAGFQLSKKQKSALVAFLKTLTDPDLATDPRLSDPFLRLNPDE